MNGLDQQIGAHSARIERLEEDVAEVRKDVKEILAILAQTKGGWKALLIAGSAAGTAGAVAAKVFGLIKGV